MSDPPSQQKQTSRPLDKEARSAEQAPGSEAKKKGGTESAKRQAERDWQDSAKESGD